MTVVYIDELLLTNFLIDYILFLLTAKLTGTPLKRLRAVLAALLGAAYAAAAFLSGLSFLLHIVVKTTVGVLMTLIAFGGGERFLRLCLVHFAVSAAFAGAVLAASMLRGGGAVLGPGPVDTLTLAVAFAVCYAVFKLVFQGLARRHVERQLTEISLKLGNRRAEFTALIDTGNALRDPLTGRPVTVCSLEAVSPLFDAATVRLMRETPDPVAALEKLRGAPTAFRLVPYSAVGTGRGLLLAFQPEAVKRDGKPVKNGLVAISPTGFSGGNGYAALTNAS